MIRFGTFTALTTVLTLTTAAWAQDSQPITTQDEIGGIYEGAFKGGLQHGIGTYTLPNGYEYSGESRRSSRR